jgi:hypothetical protein
MRKDGRYDLNSNICVKTISGHLLIILNKMVSEVIKCDTPYIVLRISSLFIKLERKQVHIDTAKLVSHAAPLCLAT